MIHRKSIWMLILSMILLVSNVSCDGEIKKDDVDLIPGNESNVSGVVTQPKVFESYRHITFLYDYPITKYGPTASGSTFLQQKQESTKMRLDLVKEYMEKNHGIIVQFDMVEFNDYEEEMKLRLSSGDNTDIYIVNNSGFYITSTSYRYSYVSEIDKEYAADISDLINQYYPEIKLMIEKDPYLQSYITDEKGKVYAVPGYIATPTNLYGLLINRGFYDMEDKDRTIEVNEVVDIFKRLENQDRYYYGICPLFDYKYMTLGNRNYISSAEIMIENYTPVPVEQSSSFEKFFDNLKQIYGSGKEVRSESFKYWNHGWLNPSMILSQSSVSETDVKMVAPAVELVSYSSFRESLKYNTKYFNENYYVMPIETEGTNPKATMEAKYFISVFSEEKEAALTFLRCMEYDETVYSLMRHGVENVDYIKTEKGLQPNAQVFIRNILNPELEVKFAHDFPSWNDYWSDYLYSQNVILYDDEEEYRNRISKTISDLRNDESDIYDANIYHIIADRSQTYRDILKYIRSDDDTKTAMQSFMDAFNQTNTGYLIDEIKMRSLEN